MHAQSLKATGPKSWEWAYISGKSQAPMLQVTSITSGTLKICSNLQITALPIYITMNSELWLWDFNYDGAMTFVQCIVEVMIVDFLKTIFARKLALRNREMMRSRSSTIAHFVLYKKSILAYYYIVIIAMQVTHFKVSSL